MNSDLYTIAGVESWHREMADQASERATQATSIECRNANLQKRDLHLIAAQTINSYVER